MCRMIVIQVSQMARAEARTFFDRNGVIEVKDYLFFNMFNQDVLSQITPDSPLLVFTSHRNDVVNASNVATKIKSINPSAIVLALTTSELTATEQENLDGVISKWSNNKRASRIAKLFLSGVPREQVIAEVQKK